MNVNKWICVGLCLCLLVGLAQTSDQAANPADRRAPASVESMVANWLALDKNEDGKLAQDEVEGLMKQYFGRNDTDRDGFLVRSELEDLARRLRSNRNRRANTNRQRPPMSTEDLLARVPEGVTILPDIAYRTGNEAWKLDLAMPKEKGGDPRPALIFVHGGGWRNGDKRASAFLNPTLEFATKGYVCITVNYRLLGNAQGIDDCIADVKCVVRWLRAHAAEYNVDPTRFGAYGNSAGAHLVSILGLCPKSARMEGDGPFQEYSSMVQAVVASATPASFMIPMSERARARQSASTMSDELKKRISPISYVNAGAPPFLLFHEVSDATVGVYQSDKLAEALKAAGAKEVLYERYTDGSGHGVFNKNIDKTGPLREAFFERVLKKDYSKAQIGTWGDQGDGTYLNPILNGDYPDVDIEQVGDTYYLITSTNHYTPGMTLLKSKDIVNWRLIGHVFDKLSWEPTYNYDAMRGYRKGVWAGDIAYHDGIWYCYFIDTASGLYMSSADKIEGPWTTPKLMLKKRGWTDPAAFWDEEEGQAYLICNFGRENPKEKLNYQRMFRMSWDGERLLDEGKVIYKGAGAEAAKIYKIKGEYYIFLAQWIEGDRKQLVLRGKSIYGPFERRIVMEKADGALRSVCQGALVQAADGSWWLTHQLVQHRGKAQGHLAGATTPRSFEGRSQWLVPVKWENGWPVVGADPDGNGIGNTVAGGKKPILGFPIDAPQTDDEFDMDSLGPQWQWNHNPRDARWSLTERPGWLRLHANVPVGTGGFWNASNTISQRLMGKGQGLITAKLDISAMQPGQQAGMARHSGRYVLLGISVDQAGTKTLVFNDNGKTTAGPVIKRDVIWLRSHNDGAQAYYEYSLDGHSFQRFGAEFILTFGRWRGDRPGFYCWNNDQGAGHIDIDFFHYDYDGPSQSSVCTLISLVVFSQN